jgi:hypothetical protein
VITFQERADAPTGTTVLMLGKVALSNGAGASIGPVVTRDGSNEVVPRRAWNIGCGPRTRTAMTRVNLLDVIVTVNKISGNDGGDRWARARPRRQMTCAGLRRSA